MTRRKSLRRQLFVDPKIQGAIVARTVLYWVVSLITITLMLLCWRIATIPPRTLYTHLREMLLLYGPAATASLILLPLVIADVVRQSNRFTGPMVRLRRSMHDLARGRRVEAITFRENDFWREFAEEFNVLAERARQSSAAAEGRPQEEPAVVGAE